MYKDTILYGLLNNKYVTPNEISDTHLGISCGCICPKCQKPLELINREGTKYFRHKSQQLHCHYEVDQQVLEFVWTILEESGFLKEFGLNMEDLQHFRSGIKVEFAETVHKESIQNNEKQELTQTQYLKDNTFKLTIKNKKYSIKLIFKTDNKLLENNEVLIDIEKMIKGKGEFVSHQSEILEGVKERLRNSISQIMENDERIRREDEEAIQNQAEKETLIKEKESQIKTLDEMLDIIPLAKKGEILKYYEKRCPKCGARMCSMKARIGATVACENYPTCNYGAGNYWL